MIHWPQLIIAALLGAWALKGAEDGIRRGFPVWFTVPMEFVLKGSIVGILWLGGFWS